MFSYKKILIFIICFLLISNISFSKNAKKIEVEVVGSEFNWYFRYPGPDGKLGGEDDYFSKQNLFLPENTDVTLIIMSKDFVYSFAIPELNKEEIAVPDLDFELRFYSGDAKKLTILGDQLCGYIHPSLIGEVVIRN